jgi:predicted membrane protein
MSGGGGRVGEGAKRGQEYAIFVLPASKRRRDTLKTKQVLPVVALLSQAALCAQAIITIDVPGADGTFPTSINNAGVIAGSYSDSNAVSHGFLRDLTGAITTFDVPAAGTASSEGTFARAINDAGVIAGWYTDTNIKAHGFLRDPTGAITTFDAPHDARGTFVTCINNAGVIAGYDTFQNNTVHGFVRTAGGNIYRFDPPGALQSEALAINAAGDITGWFSATTLLRQGFVRTADGVTTTFDAPGAGTIDNVGTFPTAINATGVIAGYALADNDEAQGWMRRIDGSFAVFQAPNAGSGGGPYGTYPAGINASGNIVGWDISLSPLLCLSWVHARPWRRHHHLRSSRSGHRHPAGRQSRERQRPGSDSRILPRFGHGFSRVPADSVIELTTAAARCEVKDRPGGRSHLSMDIRQQLPSSVTIVGSAALLFLNPAHRSQEPSAAIWRFRRRMGHVHDVLSNRAASGLPLFVLDHQVSQPHGSYFDASLPGRREPVGTASAPARRVEFR